MAEGYHDFVAAEVLTAANLEDYCQNQSVMRFASAAARDTALSTVKDEGMLAWLDDVNTMTVYSGSAWSTIGPVHGALPSWTPVIVQGATPTLTVGESGYSRVGRTIFFSAFVQITSAGTAANVITCSLPVASKTYSVYSHMGTGEVIDATGANRLHPAILRWASTTTVKFSTMGDNVLDPAYVGNDIAITLANGDFISVRGFYEAGADA